MKLPPTDVEVIAFVARGRRAEDGRALALVEWTLDTTLADLERVNLCYADEYGVVRDDLHRIVHVGQDLEAHVVCCIFLNRHVDDRIGDSLGYFGLHRMALARHAIRHR